MRYSATSCQPGEVPIPNLLPPQGSTRAARDREVQALFEFDRQFREDYPIKSEIAGPHEGPSMSWPRR